MAVVAHNVIVKSVDVRTSKKNRNKLLVNLNIKNASIPITFGLTYGSIVGLFIVCGNAASLNEIKDVPIRVLTIEEEERKVNVAIGHITSNKWYLFDTDDVREINALKYYFGVKEVIMGD